MSIHPKPKDARGRTGWLVVISYRRDGAIRRKAFVFRGTKAEAAIFEAEKKVVLERSGPPARVRTVPKFSEFCVEQYAPNAEDNLCEDTWTKRRSQIATLIEFFGDRRLDEIGEATDGYKRKRRLRPGRVKKVSVNNELRVLRRILRFAHDERGINFVVPKIVFFPVGKRRPKVWTEQQVLRLFDACKQTAPDLMPLLVFLANTGARRGEALALTWDRIDLERRMIKIWPEDDDDDDDDDDCDEGWEPKNKLPREVPISDHLVPLLRAQRSTSEWVFPCPSTGNRYACWPDRKFQRVQKLAGLRGGVHTLRHTYASLFLRERPDFFLLSKILGHSSVGKVTELYSHLLPDHLELGRNAVVIAPPTGSPSART